MAFPTIPTTAAGRVLTANQLNTTATRTFPDLSGLTKKRGDLLIAIVVGYQSSATANAVWSGWSTGWTEFLDYSTTTGMCIGAAYKWSTGAETGTISVTQAATITGDASMILLSIAGAHASTPPEGGSGAQGTTAAADPAAFNPSGWDVEDTLWISVIGSGMTSGTGSWTGTGATAPTNFTDFVRTNASDTSTVGDCEAAVSFRQNAVASEDVGAASGVDLSNARNAAVVIAVRPAVPPPAKVVGYATGTSNTTTLTATKADLEASLGGTLADGDVLVAMQCSDAGALADMTASTGTWSTPLSHLNSSVVLVKVWGRVAASEGASWSFGQASGADGVVTVVAVRGVDLDTAVGSITTSAASTSRSIPTVDHAGITGSVLLAGAAMDGNNVAVTWAVPTGWAELADAQSTTWATQAVGALTSEPADPTASATFTATSAGGGTGVQWALVLPPVPKPPPIRQLFAAALDRAHNW